MSQPARPPGRQLRRRPLRPIDSHCHLADEAFTTDISSVVRGPGGGLADRALHPRRRRRPRSCARAAGLRELWPERALRGRRAPASRRHVSRRPAGARRRPSSGARRDARAARRRRDGARLPLRLLAARRAAARVRGAGRAGADAPAAGGHPHPRGRRRHARASSRTGRARSAASSTASPATPRWPRRALDLGFYISLLGHRDVPEGGRPARGRRRPCRPTGCWSKPTARISRRCRIAASGTSRPASSTWSKRWPRARRTTPAAIVEQTAANFDALFGTEVATARAVTARVDTPPIPVVRLTRVSDVHKSQSPLDLAQIFEPVRDDLARVDQEFLQARESRVS